MIPSMAPPPPFAGPAKPIAATVMDSNYLVVVCSDGSVYEGVLLRGHMHWREREPVPNTRRFVEISNGTS